MKANDPHLKTASLQVIGSQEWCTFKELKIPAILARIDSGAKTSSIQATNIKLIEKENHPWLRFEVRPIQKNNTVKIVCTAPLVGKRTIKGSFGISEERFIIKTPVTLGKDVFEIELSLANRNSMKYKMLLGRDAIINRYLINPAQQKLQKKFSKKEVATLYKMGNKK